ncbi:MAG: hypothetical protein F6K19_02280 [Cyanothece sp. SIO1E1]|nr:hypothetical protein [Cyanothece sp. SIO1E1]
MFLSFNHLWAFCKRENDPGRDGEYYWTWQVRTGITDNVLVARGFTTGIAAKEGYRIEEAQIRTHLFDPKFIIELPKLENPGDSNRISLQFFCFEHDDDDDTVKIKTIFSNKASQFLIDFANHNQIDRNKAKEELKGFLEGSNESGLATILGAVVTSIPDSMLKVPDIFFGLFDSALKALLENRDDMVGSRRMDLFYTLDSDGNLTYRWSFEGGVEAILSAEEPLFTRELIFMNAEGSEEVHSGIQLQVVLDISQLL